MKLNISTAFYTQTNVRKERVSQILEKFLRVYVNSHQDNWVELIPLAQFCYNSSYHTSIWMNPLYSSM